MVNFLRFLRVIQSLLKDWDTYKGKGCVPYLFLILKVSVCKPGVHLGI